MRNSSSIWRKVCITNFVIVRSGYKGYDDCGGGYYSRRNYRLSIPMLNFTVIFNRIKEVLNDYKTK